MADKRTLLISCEMPHKIEEILGFLGYGCVRLPSCAALDTPVASHPDMLFYKLPSGELLCDSQYFEENAPLLLKTGARFTASAMRLGKKYPHDVLFDAFAVDGTLYARLDAVAPEIADSYERAVNVKQGYAKCSTLLAGELAVTADKGIYKALTENGVKTLLISPETVRLTGYGCGFIGGASFFDEKSRTVVLFGEPKTDDPVPSFLEENGIRVMYPYGFPLTDFGGAIAVDR